MVFYNLDTSTDDAHTGVFFFLSDSCEFCEMAKPHINNLVDKFSGKVNMYILNADDNKVEEFMENFRIDGVPYFSVMISGDMISGHKGIIQVESDGGKAFFDDFGSYISVVFDVK